MNFLYQAAEMYKEKESKESPISAHFLRELVQVSEKKMIRMYFFYKL